MTGILLDTCTLLWWTLDPEQLSAKAAAACNKIEVSTGYVSSVSVWEIGIKIKNQQLNIGMTIERYAKLLDEIPGLVILPVDLSQWIKSLSLNWEHKDPADRLIVATAQIKDLYLVTNDKIIVDFYSRCIV